MCIRDRYTELSFLFEHQMLHVEANQAITRKRTTNVFTELSKGDCGLLQSESLFAAALNRRSSYFRTLSHKTGVNANPLTGTNDA